ncbi:MAG TPA: hypothetical protein VML19_23470 [Verrucomicrobiae bacterium]|nr:hypothetical protein [Verrucomicrobiae bacterium]
MGAGWRLYGIWICFAARLLFYASMLPLWEGYDEWAHFSVIRIMATRGVALAPRYAPVPRDVAESLDLAPVPWELRGRPSPAVTQDAFWRLAPEERAGRERVFRNMPPAWRQETEPTLTAYEALQPPLYYWLMTPVLYFASHFSLGAQVVTLRYLSVLLASLAIPLFYRIAMAVFDDADVALACTAVAALMPEWALDVARVGNDCLSLVLFTLVIWIGLKLLEDGPTIRWSVAMGAALGCGLLTKAWFLAAAPPVALLYFGTHPGAGGDKQDAPGAGRSTGAARTSACATLLIATAISGWWYIHNLVTTGTLSGLSESVILRRTGIGELAAAAVHIPWPTAIDSILFSHLYYGGWSSLTVRSWMYHVFYVLVLAAAIGLVRVARRPSLVWLLLIYATFWLGQLYNVVLIFMSKGVPTSMGWYLFAAVAAEVPLCVAGLRGLLPKRFSNWPLFVGALLFGLLDLYTVHAVAMPYYTGLIAHRATGALASLPWADFRLANLGVVFHRLVIFKGAAMVWPVILVLWVVYLLTTLWLMLGGAEWAAPGRRRDILR